MNRTQIKSTLLEALTEAGKLLKNGLTDVHTVTKKTELSIVTEIDHKAEETILRIIRKHFPDHAFLTEESPPMGSSKSRWIIDPLDGTTNFAHTFPIACVSIGYEENGRMELGGVLDPFRGELFLGETGKGATMNGQPIRVSKTPDLNDTLLCTGFPYDRRERPDDYLALFKAFMMKVQGLRRTGSAALDLCYVACGRFDGFWEVKLQAWDKAAAMVIVKEAGGTLSNFSGEPLTLEDIQNVADNGLIHREMMETLKPFERFCKES